jgi:uncharacterized delta-60 repeat protein
LASSQLVLLRFNPDGSLDAAFNGGGMLVAPPGASRSDWCAGLAIQPDGKIVIAGSSDIGTMRAFTIFRYNADGTADATFGTNGRASMTIGNLNTVQVTAFVRQPSGRLIVAGFVQNYSSNVATDSSLVLAGFTPDGIPDAGFGMEGIVKIMPGEGTSDAGATVKDAQVQPDGKMLILLGSFSAGYPDRLMLLDIDGAADNTFGVAGLVSSTSRLPKLSAIATQPDGNIVAVGLSSSFNFALERFKSGAVPAMEFYNPSLDHYFLSMNPQEVDDLDLGVHGGWMRTGFSLQTFGNAAAAAGTSAVPVCRFYIPPEHGDSHFLSADPRECGQVLSNIIYVPNFSGYIEETPSAFYVTLPDMLTGACPAMTVPVYRLWNQRFDSNHRYTTSLAIKAQMIAKNYVAEGYGPNVVDMCAPQ